LVCRTPVVALAGSLFWSAAAAQSGNQSQPFRTGVDVLSVGAHGPVLQLTRQNLKQAFPGNHRFHDALGQTFRTEAELAQREVSQPCATAGPPPHE